MEKWTADSLTYEDAKRTLQGTVRSLVHSSEDLYVIIGHFFTPYFVQMD